MNTMNLPLTTYGSTPAAQYLVRTLNSINNQRLTRSVGAAISTSNKAVNELLRAYETGSISSKTMSTCLRLLREDITNCTTNEFNDEFALVTKLRKNVQIGVIKQCLRLASVAARARQVMASPDKRSNQFTRLNDDSSAYAVDYVFKNHQTNQEHIAGTRYLADGHTVNAIIGLKDIVGITPETLMERSNRRCTRLGKPHTK